jgi:hypothetical protein
MAAIEKRMSEPERRGALFTTFLIALTIGSVLVALSDAVLSHRLMILYPQWAAYSFAAISALRLIVVAGIWFRSRVATLLFVLLSAFTIAIHSVIGSSPLPIFVAGFSALLLILFAFPRWKGMPWLLSNVRRANKRDASN